MHHNLNWLIMHTATASGGSSGPMSRSSWSRIPWNKHLVSSWSRLPQDVFRTHGSSSVTHICINASDDTINSSAVCSRWPNTLVWSSMVQDIKTPKTSESSGHQTGPTPVCQDKPQFGNFDGSNHFRHMSMACKGRPMI